MMAQMSTCWARLTLKVNDRKVEVMALIQEEAPQDLLIDTDCLTKLGSNLSIIGEVLTMGPATENRIEQETPVVKF